MALLATFARFALGTVPSVASFTFVPVTALSLSRLVGTAFFASLPALTALRARSPVFTAPFLICLEPTLFFAGRRRRSAPADGPLSAPTIPTARVTNASGEYQGVPGDGEFTTLLFHKELYDSAGLYDPAASARLTVPVTGVYVITANVEWGGELPGEASSTRTLALARNGKAFIAQDRRDAGDYGGPGEAPENSVQSITAQALLTAGEFVTVAVLHSDTAELEISSYTNSFIDANPEFAMTWLAPGPAS